MHPSSERDNKIYHVAVPEMPTSGDLKSALNGNDLGHYITSYMMHILSKFQIIVLMPEIIFVND